MSLVAYGASDDENSETSDAENEEQSEATAVKIIAPTKASRSNSSPSTVSSSEASTNLLQDGRGTSGYISDEDDFEHVSSTSTSSAVFSSSSVTSGVNNAGSTATHLEALPAPQKNEEILEEDELEEEVKLKVSEIAIAPKPPKKQRQPVKITIPSLNETPEEEESNSKKKNATTFTKKSGLFSLLPAPVHSARKEINRPLIPHTLSKKPPVSKTPVSKPSSSSQPSGIGSSSQYDKGAEAGLSPKRMSQFNALTGYDDSDSDTEADQDGGSVNFFSIDSSSKSSSSSSNKDPIIERLQSQEISSSDVPVQQDRPEPKPQTVSTENEVAGEDKPLPGPELGLVNDAPLEFGSRSRLSQWAVGSQSFLSPVGPSGPVGMSSHGVPYGASASAMYNLANSEYVEPNVDTQEVSSDDLRQFMGDREFHQFQGKRKRGMEEEITFVDANVDDYVDPSEVTKHLTEETDYVSHKSKDNLPTSQQRRKKQITYLAHQAKEKELELKNTWAQNRMTKKQTQSKYGF